MSKICLASKTFNVEDVLVVMEIKYGNNTLLEQPFQMFYVLKIYSDVMIYRTHTKLTKLKRIKVAVIDNNYTEKKTLRTEIGEMENIKKTWYNKLSA